MRARCRCCSSHWYALRLARPTACGPHLPSASASQTLYSGDPDYVESTATGCSYTSSEYEYDCANVDWSDYSTGSESEAACKARCDEDASCYGINYYEYFADDNRCFMITAQDGKRADAQLLTVT